MAAEITWRELRALAELAQGKQHEPLGIRIDDEGKLVVETKNDDRVYLATMPATPKADRSADLKITVDPEVTVTIDGKDTKVREIHAIADAAFWSLAAVEKFLLPYYASFKNSESFAKELLDQFANRDVLAILHLPNSEPSIARTEFFAMVAEDGPQKGIAKTATLVPLRSPF